MRSILYRQHGRPSEVLETVSVDPPAGPDAGEVLVRVLSRPVHYGDLLGIAGRYRLGGDFSVPAEGNRVGFEGFGIVESVGEGVDLKPRTRVAFFPGRAAWSELAIVSADYVTVLPDTVSDDIAAQLHVNPLTAALLVRAVLSAGAAPGNGVVLLTAAGSSVAKLVLATLAERGVDTIAVVRSVRGKAELEGLFPGQQVVATDSATWQNELASQIGDRPVTALLDAVGGPVASELFTLLSGGGSVISYGDLSGEPITVPALHFSTRNLRIVGVTVGSWAGLPREQRDEDLALALGLAERMPQLFPVAGKYDLAAAREAATKVEEAGKAGVVLLTSL